MAALTPQRLDAVCTIMITSHRQSNGVYRLELDGKKVGEAWNRRRQIGGSRTFGLRLDGYYWIDGKANQCNGAASTSGRLLRDVIALAEEVLRTHHTARSPDQTASHGTSPWTRN
ncbi:MAG: hypothetical protein Q8R01_13505 [Ramlibacter sp.]|nr:hypothetical protein [Ramlibacter sp.]